MLTSLIFWTTYLIEGFQSQLLYFIILLGVTIISVFSFTIIKDLDNPLNGSLTVSLDKYHVCKEFIIVDTHEIYVNNEVAILNQIQAIFD